MFGREKEYRATGVDADVIIDVGVGAREESELRNRQIERKIQ